MTKKENSSALLLWGRRALVILFWLAVWQIAAIMVSQKILLATPLETLRCMTELLPQPLFWKRVFFSTLRILAGFLLGAVCALVLAPMGHRYRWLSALLALPMRLVKATPVASFIILALLWVSSRWLSVLISFLMVLPVLYGAVETGLETADGALLEMARVFRLGFWARVKAIWLPALMPAFRQSCSVALGICWKSGIAAEVIGLPNGSIGDALYRAKITLSTGEVFAWTVVIILLSTAFERVFLLLLKRAEKHMMGGEVQC